MKIELTAGDRPINDLLDDAFLTEIARLIVAEIPKQLEAGDLVLENGVIYATMGAREDHQ
jgi:hypothetical protein